MKLTDGVLIIENNGEEFVITVGNATKKFSGMIRLNKTAAYIAHALENDISEDEIMKNMLEKYDVSKEDALNSIRKVIDKFDSLGILNK